MKTLNRYAVRTTVVLWVTTLVQVLWSEGRVGAAEPPFTATWTSVPDLAISAAATIDGYAPVIRSYGALSDGRPLFVAAKPEEDFYRFLLFDPQSNAWQWRARVPVYGNLNVGDVYNLLAFPLSAGRCLVVGTPTTVTAGPGVTALHTYLYDSAADAFLRIADLPLAAPAYGCTGRAITLPNGEIYMFGGLFGFIYNFDDNAWRTGPACPNQISPGIWGAVVWPDGRTVVSADNSYVTFDPADMLWYPPHPESVYDGTLVGGAISRGWNGFVAAAIPYTPGGPSGMRVHQVDPTNSKSTLIHERIGVNTWQGHAFVSPLATAGRDWLCVTTTTNGASSADFGLYDSQVRDVSDSTWFDLPRCPQDMLVTANSPDERVRRTLLSDGFVFVSWRQGSVNDGLLRAARLQVSAPFVPPEVVADLPTNLSLDEGTSQTFAYHLTGDMPADGVDVLVERVSGDGDVRVVDGAIQRVMERMGTRTVRVAGLTDADNADDAATLRVRVAQPGGGADPNARTIAVTVRDLYQQATQMPGDVNGDGDVNASDLDEVVRNFGKTAGGN